MVTLQPAHPVYAAQEDAYQRDQQAEAYAEVRFGLAREVDVLGMRALRIAAVQRHALEDKMADLIAEAFIDGWNAAREQQRNS